MHAPDGGQGLNTGMQDTVNLGWKLAQVVNRTSPESLLDTYHAERHPVAARVLRNTMAQVALRRPDERTKALRDTMSELLRMDDGDRVVGLARRSFGSNDRLEGDRLANGGRGPGDFLPRLFPLPADNR